MANLKEKLVKPTGPIYLDQIDLIHVRDRTLSANSDTRSKLLTAAVELFGVRGFEGCTMRDIAQSVGFTAPAIYNHYSSKQQLLVAAVDFILSDFLIAVLDGLEAYQKDNVRLFELVRRHAYYMTSRLETATANEHLLEPEFMARSMPLEAADRFRAARRAYTHIVGQLVSSAAPARVGVDQVVRTFAVISVMNYVYWWYRPHGRLRPEDVAEQTCQLVAEMLGTSVPTA